MGFIEQWGLALALVLPTLVPVLGVLLAGIILQRKKLLKDRERFAAVRAVSSARRRGAKPMNQWKKH